MANINRIKIALVAAVAILACALIVAPAYGFYYVHDEQVASSDAEGVIMVPVTVDQTAVNGGVKAGVVVVPDGSNASDVIQECAVSSEDANSVEAVHDHSTSSLADTLSGRQYTCTVYKAESQNPGTQSTLDGNGTTGNDTVLENWDHLVVTVTQ